MTIISLWIGLLKAFSRKKFVDPATVQRTEFFRRLTKFDLTLLGVSASLGGTAYILIGVLARNIAGPGLVISFFIAAVASLTAGLCYAEFAARIPRIGSAYVFSYVTIGELCAFLIGWNVIFEYLAGASAPARAWSSYVDSALLNDTVSNITETGLIKLGVGKDIANQLDFLAFLSTFAMTAVLSFGVKLTTWANNIITAINLLITLFIIIAGATFAEGKNWTTNFLPFGFSGVLTASPAAFYAYIGFDVIAISVEESKNPSKDVPIATVLTTGKHYFDESGSLRNAIDPYAV